MANLLSKIFGKKEIEDSTAQTAPLSLEKTQPVPEKVTTVISPHQLIVGIAQSVGKVRDHNEDSVFVFNTILAGEGEGVPIGLFIVADGMGGHQHGEIASNVASKTLAGSVIRKIYLPVLSEEATQQSDSMQEIMLQGIQEAQEAVRRLAPGGGTTLTSAFIMGDQVTLTHVGDSRAYFFSKDGTYEAITRDHSLVRRLQELGQLTEQEASIHPQRNVLYRAIGQGEPFDPDISTQPYPSPGYLLLCSDGLWGVVPEEKLAEIIKLGGDPVSLCRRMIDAANEAGGPDNISVIIVQNFG